MPMIERAWPTPTATGLGSLPGDSPDEAVRLVLGEVADLPYLPELPGRGLGADMIGRTGTLLVDLPLEWQPHGWTVASHSGLDARRARDWLSRDLDALTEHGQGLDVVKVQVCGPLTLAASVELTNLYKVLGDHGALRDLSASLAEGVGRHLADLRTRLPGTRIVLQVDEPALPAVLAGTVPTPSGYGTLRSLPRSVVGPALGAVLAAAEPGHRVVHCCAADVPFDLIAGAAADAVAVDYALLGKPQLDAIGELIDAGRSIWLGIAPASDTDISLAALRHRVESLWHRLGFPDEQRAAAVVVTPACGLAGASPPYVRRVMRLLNDTARSLAE